VLRHSARVRRYFSTLLQTAACQVRLTAHVLGVRCDDLAVCAEKLPGCILVTLNRPFKAAVLIFAISASFLAHRSLYRYALSRTNRGVLYRSQPTALTEPATAYPTTRFLASETNVLGERELQNRCTWHSSVFKNARDNPRVRKRKRPVTPGVPARLD
jgi:hypothetical protein